MQALFYGLSTGFSLIVGIGAQNVFVLKQGLKKKSIFWVCFVCAVSDSLLIFCGVMGMSHLVVDFPQIVTITKYIGAAFLACYGLRHFIAALYNTEEFVVGSNQQQSVSQILLTCLALTWLNPHVYLDTLFLVGSISVKFQEVALEFALGAMLASWIFFYVLGYGARVLLPLFEKPNTWRYLNAGIAMVMWSIAWRLLVE